MKTEELKKAKRYKVYAGDANIESGEHPSYGDRGYLYHDMVLASDYDMAIAELEARDKENEQLRDEKGEIVLNHIKLTELYLNESEKVKQLTKRAETAELRIGMLENMLYARNDK